MVFLRSVLISSIMVALSACGGGDSKSGSTETEKPAAASERATPDEKGRIALTTENAEAVLAGFETYTSKVQGLYDPYAVSPGAEVTEVSAMAGVQIELAATPWGWATESDVTAEDPAAGETQTGLRLLESGDYACSDAGSFKVSHENDGAAGITHTEAYKACASQGLIREGTQSHRFEDFRGSNSIPGYIRVVIEEMHLTDGSGVDLVLDGELALQVSSEGATKSIRFDGGILDNPSGRIFLAQDLVIDMPRTASFGADLGYRYRVSGAFGDSELGYVTLSNEPAMGTIVFTGKNRSKIRMSVVESINQRVIAVDADGDSSYESQWYLPW